MLPFYYTFLILVLSSCVVAMPPERVLPKQVPLGPTRTTNYQDDWDSKYLIDNKDVRLPMGLWGRVEMSAEDTGEKWTAHAQYRDAAIQFVRGTNGVDKVQLRQIMRELLPNEPRRRRPREESYINEYRVNRTHRGEDHRPAVTKKILPEPLPIKTSGSYLHDTYWARNPDVLGKTKSGPINFKDWGYIIHIEWRIDPIEGVKVPYVTLIPKEGEKVVKAKERYMLDDQQAALVRAEHEWLMYPKYYEENVEHFLLYSQDVRLPKGLWGQVRMSAAGTIATWSHDWGLDRVIQFEEGTIGVRKVNLRKIKRELMPIMPKKNGPKRQRIKPSNKYCVFRTHDGGPAETLPLQLGLAIEESELYLHNTYWARIPDILGDSEYLSGPREERQYIIYIYWKLSPTYKKDVPIVTFLQWPHLLKARDCYDLQDQEVKALGEVTMTSGLPGLLVQKNDDQTV